MLYNNHHFVKLFTREITIQRLEVISSLAKFGRVNHLILIPTGEGILANFWFEERLWKKYCNSLFPKMIKSDWLNNFIDMYEEGKNKLLYNSRTILKKSNILSVKELYAYYNLSMQILKSPWGEIIWQPWALDNAVIPKIKKLLLNEVGEERFSKIWKTINLPTDYIAIQKIQLKILKSFIDNQLNKEIKNTAKEFAWITVNNYCDTPLKKDYFESFVNNLTKIEAKKKRTKIKNYITNNKKRVNFVINGIKDDTLKRLLKIINFYAVFRTLRIEVLKESFYCLSKFFEKLLYYVNEIKSGKWEFNDIINFTYIEIKDHFQDGKDFPELKEIRQRQNLDYIHYYIDSKIFLIIDKKKIKSIKEQAHKNLKIKSFKGHIASKGKAKGKCKLVFSVSQLNKIKKGDILVAPMTFTEYLPGMEKALAFVTNEGGIGCHAAIIAREMNKPCVVGTEVATKVLSDGDLIEVNADKGIVKIIKKAKKV